MSGGPVIFDYRHIAGCHVLGGNAMNVQGATMITPEIFEWIESGQKTNQIPSTNIVDTLDEIRLR